MTVEIICADAREALAAMPDGSVHTCVTSPPYWGLRDYSIGPDELGLEPTPELYVEHIVQVMREVRRVLRDDGTLWLNLGDSYASSGQPAYQALDKLGERLGTGGGHKHSNHPCGRAPTPPGLKPKDLVGIPWRVAFALQADGWWLRSDIVWSKPNPMPESVTDRPTRSHEYMFLLTKKARYYYDADAIREPNLGIERPNFDGQRGCLPKSFVPGRSEQRDRAGNHPAGRNRRSVWEIATQPYPKAHFATFPEKLVEPCILAGTSERGCCPECGAPWERVVEAEGGTIGRSWHDHEDDGARGQRAENAAKGGHGYRRVDRGWRPACDHDGEPVPCRVLDPFAGSGTVGLVAERLGRHSILIEMSADYCKMARERTAQMGLMAPAK